MTERRTKIFFILVVGMVLVFSAPPLKAQAGSAVIQFSTTTREVQKGDIFTVICQVTSTDSFLDTEFQIEYDAELVQFLKGGSKVTGGNGILNVSSTGNEESVSKKTFSLQFVANKKGSAVFEVKGTASIRDGDGNSFSSSSNRLVVTVKKKSSSGQVQEQNSGQGQEPGPGQEPEMNNPSEETPKATPEPVLSSNNKLKDLKTSALDFTPTFTSSRKKYTATVDYNTDILYISFQAEDDTAKVQLKGNENLKEGKNKVRIIVTAQTGETRTYSITVTRETAQETEERTGGETGSETTDVADISFRTEKDGNKVILKNSYEFEVLDPSGLKEVPAGYILSSIEVDGTQIPAFTMENDLDNNYLLMYLRGPAGESSIYQYDRTEKTLQRYTGNMIEKVNRSAGSEGEGSGLSISNYVLFGIIIGLVIIILCMLIAMLKMAMKKKEDKKEISEGYDEERFYR